jgi:hypothetical protein
LAAEAIAIDDFSSAGLLAEGFPLEGLSVEGFLIEGLLIEGLLIEGLGTESPFGFLRPVSSRGSEGRQCLAAKARKSSLRDCRVRLHRTGH